MKNRIVKKFEDIPNVGPRIGADFKTLGLKEPHDLKGQDALALYKKLCVKTKVRHDTCVLDTFMAVVDYMNGAPPTPWWHYTPERKKLYPHI